MPRFSVVTSNGVSGQMIRTEANGPPNLRPNVIGICQDTPAPGATGTVRSAGFSFVEFGANPCVVGQMAYVAVLFNGQATTSVPTDPAVPAYNVAPIGWVVSKTGTLGFVSLTIDNNDDLTALVNGNGAGPPPFPQYSLVASSGSPGKMLLTGANGPPFSRPDVIGVCQGTPAAGETALVKKSGFSWVEFGANACVVGSMAYVAVLNAGQATTSIPVDPSVPSFNVVQIGRVVATSGTLGYVSLEIDDDQEVGLVNNSGSTIPQFNVVQSTAAGEMGIAFADTVADSVSVIGVTVASVPDGSAGLVQGSGYAWIDFGAGARQIGAIAYLSALVAGQATTTAPTDNVVPLGLVVAEYPASTLGLVRLGCFDEGELGHFAVSTVSILQQISTARLATGVRRFVRSYRAWFTLDKETSRTAETNVTIVALGTGFWVRDPAPDPSWAIQPTWFIDPISGDDQRVGDTGVTALKTRSEFARRTANVRMTVDMTVTIMSSLNVGDTLMPSLSADEFSGLTVPGANLFYVGVPTVLFSGIITAYTARNGATSQTTLMTIASLPVSWTASGLLNKVIEWTDGVGNFIRSTVVADLGAKTARLSAPINQNFIETPFVNSTVVNVYQMPSLGTVMQTIDPFAQYSYLDADGWGPANGTPNSFINCTGINLFAQFGTNIGLANCCFTGSMSASGNVSVTGGSFHPSLGLGGSFRINVALTCIVGGGANCITSNGAVITTIAGGTQGTADVEFYTTSATAAALDLAGVFGHNRCIFGGYFYGVMNGGDAVKFDSALSGYVQFSKIPNLGASKTINCTISGVQGNTDYLAYNDFIDPNNNQVIGPGVDP